MKDKEYLSKLKNLLKKTQFTVKEAEKEGVSRQVLSILCKKGHLERIARGIYRSVNFEFSDEYNIIFEELFKNALAIKNGIICLISALSYYDLTDEIPREHWIAIPNSQKVKKMPNVRFVRMRNITLGVITIKVGQYKVKIFDRERCIIDAFRYLSKEIAIKAIKAYFESKEIEKSISKLSKYAEQLRINIKPYILAFTT
ncbi:MAG: type IV toxin-antitoxin system AbiEi family antitoxin domain-containing protein [Candidatus Lokiarchaeota archaeon]|nr:type IV toxin-antitoxin system AbiEi family antitoxin domain-containing protein [Candidatus Lokiarchaeota archaeon]